MTQRAAFEKWLMDVHGLDSNWNEERNCFDDFPAHLAFKAWQAATAVKPELVVKALEWRAERDGRWKTGVKPNSFKAKNYHVFLSKHDGRWHIDDGHFTFFRRSFSSLSSAQGAAQDDFEMNILKSLEPWS